MIEPYLDRFIAYLQDAMFFEAHEALEEFWFPRRFNNSDEVKIARAFINASVSFELYKRNRLEASKRVWLNYVKYQDLIAKYPQYTSITTSILKVKEALF